MSSTAPAAALTLASAFWCVALAAAPVAATATRPESRHLSAALYLAGRQVCHQRARRSFHLRGAQLPVCARCYGLYLSAVLGGAIAWRRPSAARPRRPGVALAVAAAPTGVTLAVEAIGLADPGNLMRAIASAPLGAVAACVCAGALVGAERPTARGPSDTLGPHVDDGG
jgi:uncharacterized membrane protein